MPPVSSYVSPGAPRVGVFHITRRPTSAICRQFPPTTTADDGRMRIQAHLTPARRPRGGSTWGMPEVRHYGQPPKPAYPARLFPGQHDKQCTPRPKLAAYRRLRAQSLIQFSLFGQAKVGLREQAPASIVSRYLMGLCAGLDIGATTAFSVAGFVTVCMEGRGLMPAMPKLWGKTTAIRRTAAIAAAAHGSQL